MESRISLQPTQKCASIVQGWLKQLGAGATAKLPQTTSSSGEVSAAFAPRAERLGLGAKYISHADASALGIEEKRFSNALKRSSSGGASSGNTARDGDASKGASKVSPHAVHLGGKANGKQKKGAKQQDLIDEDEDDDEGRAASFQRKKQRR
jgi:hypothetical protein